MTDKTASDLADELEGDDAERCIACALVLNPDDLVLCEIDGGYIHADCCGPERESYFKGAGEPLGPDDPIPTPFRYGGDDKQDPARQALTGEA